MGGGGKGLLLGHLLVGLTGSISWWLLGCVTTISNVFILTNLSELVGLKIVVAKIVQLMSQLINATKDEHLGAKCDS